MMVCVPAASDHDTNLDGDQRRGKGMKLPAAAADGSESSSSICHHRRHPFRSSSYDDGSGY